MAQCRRIHGEGGCCAWGRSVPSREAQRWRLTPPAAQRFLEKRCENEGASNTTALPKRDVRWSRMRRVGRPVRQFGRAEPRRQRCGRVDDINRPSS